MINVIVPTYNSAKWLPLCINILKLQTNPDFKCVFIDDCSTDNSAETIKKNTKDDKRFYLISNDIRTGSPIGNYIKGFDFLNPDDEDIVVTVDGDDWLADVFVLGKLQDIYENGCWMTYGGWKVYPSEETYKPFKIPQSVHNNNAYRDIPFFSTHIRTHKAFLRHCIDDEDLIDPRTNKHWTEAGDVAYTLPLLELCGEDKIQMISDNLYILNRENPLNELKLKRKEQGISTSLIHKQKKYEKINNMF